MFATALVERDRRHGSACRPTHVAHRHRQRRRARADAAGHAAPAATRSSTPGARSRPTRSSSQVTGATGVQVPLTAGRAARPGRDGRRGHRPHPAGAGLQPEQPDRAGRDRARSWRRSSTGCRRDVLVVLDEAYREFVRDPQVPDGVELLPGAAQRRRAADVLQGVRAGRAAGRLRGRAPGRSPTRCARRRCRSASRARRRPRRSPRSGCRGRAARAGRRAGRRARPGGRRRCAARAGTVPDTQANFVWLRLGDADRRLRRRLPAGAGSPSARSPARAPVHGRRAGRQRPAAETPRPRSPPADDVRSGPRNGHGGGCPRHYRWVSFRLRRGTDAPEGGARADARRGAADGRRAGHRRDRDRRAARAGATATAALALPAVAPPEPVDTPMVVPRLLQVSRPIPPAATWLRKHPQPPCDQDGRRGRGR